jgi:hypothetical protein
MKRACAVLLQPFAELPVTDFLFGLTQLTANLDNGIDCMIAGIMAKLPDPIRPFCKRDGNVGLYDGGSA